MHPITLEKLKVNFANAHRMWSNWIMGVAGIGTSAFLQLPVDQQQAIVGHLWVPAWLVPLAVSVFGIAARLWPQHAISASVAAAKSEDAPQPPEQSS